MLILAAGFIGIFFICQFVVFPLIDKREQLQRTLLAKSRSLSEVQKLAMQYNQIRKQSDSARDRIAKSKSSFSLFSFLDRTAGAVRLKDRIAYMKPSTSAPKNSPFKISTVELKLLSITLDQLVSYLYKIETANNTVHVKRLSIARTGKKNDLLTVIMEIESYKI